MKTYSIVIIVLLLIVSFSLKADTIVQLHTISYHANRTANFNEENYGIGIRHYTDTNSYISIGTYENSEYNTTKYLGVGYDWDVKNIKLGFSAGIITGYKVRDVLPYIVPTLRYKQIAIIVAPYPEAVVHMTVDVLKW